MSNFTKNAWDALSWAGAGSSQGSARPAGGSNAGGGGGAASKVDDKTKESVRVMQRLLNSFGDMLGKMTADDINSKLINGISADKREAAVKAAAKAINTSWGLGTAFDGLWGSNTARSLDAVKQFITDFQIQGVILTSKAPADTTKVAEEADANTDNLKILFRTVGGEAPGGNAGGESIYDVVKKGDLNADLWLNPSQGVSLRARDLQDPYNFLRWLSGVGVANTNCSTMVPVPVISNSGKSGTKPAAGGPMTAEDAKAAAARPDTNKADDGKFASLAKMVLDSTIVRLGADAPRAKVQRLLNDDKDNPEYQTENTTPVGSARTDTRGALQTGAGKTNADKPAAELQKGCICIDVIDDALKTLDNRSRERLDFLSENKNREHPAYKGTGRRITNEDIRAAKEYDTAIGILRTNWDDMRGQLLNFMSKQPDMAGKPACISPSMMREFFRNMSRGSARGEGGDENGRRRNRGGGGRSEGRGEGLGRNNEKGPFEASYIDFDDLADAGYLADNWNQFLTTWKNRQIERRDLMGSHWRDFGRRHLDEAKAENPNFVTGQLRELRKLMLSIYNNWKDGGGNRRNRPPRDLIRSQNEILRDWDSVIQNLANNTQA